MKKKVVQFNERHKWCGCFGFVNEETSNRLMIGVPMPQQGTAYIFCKEEDVDYIGETDLLPIGEED